MNTINALDANFSGKHLGVLYKAVSAESTASTEQAPQAEYDALTIPPTLEDQKNLLTQLLDMFCVSSSGNFDAEQVARMRESLAKTMPDPEKDAEQFSLFVRGRCHGAFEMLRLLVVMQSKQQPRHQRNFGKSEVLNEALRLGLPSVHSGGLRTIQSLRGDERNEELHRRVERVNFILMIGPLAGFEEFNKEKLPQVTKRFLDHQLGQTVTRIIDIFTERGGAFAQTTPAPEYATAQWSANLLNKLNTFNLERTEAREELETLLARLKGAEETEVFIDAINEFAAQPQ